MRHLIMLVLLLSCAAVMAQTKDAEADCIKPNCLIYGEPASCYEWTYEWINFATCQSECFQVPVPESAEQFCTNEFACINNGLCDGNGGCAANVNVSNSKELCVNTSTATGDGYTCSCLNNECLAFPPPGNNNDPTYYPASTEWCTVQYTN